jgi:hypothetical protein
MILQALWRNSPAKFVLFFLIKIQLEAQPMKPFVVSYVLENIVRTGSKPRALKNFGQESLTFVFMHFKTQN